MGVFGPIQLVERRRGEYPLVQDTVRGRAYPPGRACLPRGRLVASLTSTPSLLDCVCSKKDPREGFVPFDIPFLRNIEIRKKKVSVCNGPLVNSLVLKII